MEQQQHTARRILRFAGEVVAETLWPTRCALCDVPGKVLCDACAARLPVLDWWKACPRCGSALGLVQCHLCNPVSLQRIGRTQLPFAACASPMVFYDDTTGRLVRVFKDQGECRLAAVLANYMVRCIAPNWRFNAVTFVPASKAAFRYRGFDHAQLIAQQIAQRVDVPCLSLLQRPHTRDQRNLGASDRIANLGHAFTAYPCPPEARGVLLIDDVFTTGATLCAATDALLAAGAHTVYALTFARV